MKIKVGTLRKIIFEEVNSHFNNDPYDSSLLDGEFEKKSTYVPDDIKEKIKKWAKDMKLIK